MRRFYFQKLESPVQSKYRRQKVREKRHEEWLEEARKPKPPEPPPRKEYKKLEQDRVYRFGWHRPQERLWLVRHDEDEEPEPEPPRLMSIGEAISIVNRMGKSVSDV